MAIVFVSPRKRKRIFFWIISISLIVLLAIVAFIAFPPEFRNTFVDVPTTTYTVKPKININFDLLDSDQVKGLLEFSEIPVQFNYTATDINKQEVSGSITSFSKEDAISVLKQQGLEVTNIEQAGIGRNEPFLQPASFQGSFILAK